MKYKELLKTLKDNTKGTNFDVFPLSTFVVDYTHKIIVSAIWDTKITGEFSVVRIIIYFNEPSGAYSVDITENRKYVAAFKGKCDLKICGTMKGLFHAYDKINKERAKFYNSL
jgi:hypothetical protein